MNSDFKELLQIFEQLEVEYLVVGGYAVMVYSEDRHFDVCGRCEFRHRLGE